MESRDAEPKNLALMLLKRASILLLAMSLFSLFFWTAGNFNRFLDETQLMLLGALRWTSLALCLVSALGFVASAAFGGRGARGGRRRHPGRLWACVGYLVLAGFGSAALVFAELLVAATGGGAG